LLIVPWAEVFSQAKNYVLCIKGLANTTDFQEIDNCQPKVPNMITFPKNVNNTFFGFCTKCRAHLYRKEFVFKILCISLYWKSCNLVSFVTEKGIQKVKLQSSIAISVWTSFSHLLCMFNGSIFTFNMYCFENYLHDLGSLFSLSTMLFSIKSNFPIPRIRSFHHFHLEYWNILLNLI
jgi:hypothetical protein